MSAAVIFLFAFALYALGVASAPLRNDEYYTLLAARSFAADGIPRIGDGVYERGLAFTAIVAASLRAFGDTLFSARLPALLPASVLVALAFLWTRREVGTAAAWLLAVYLVLSKSTVAVAQYSRFYALHSLLFFACAIGLYLLLSPRAGKRSTAWKTVITLTVVACAAFALHLQDTTLIGLAGLAAWALIAVAMRHDLRARLTSRGTLLASGLAFVLLVVLVLAFDAQAVLARLYEKYRWVALWNAENQDNARYYLQQLERQLPVFLYTYPIAVLVALGRAPRATLFSVVVTTVALLIHSFGGMKAPHYIHYLWPFLLLPAAVASASLATFVMRSLATLAASYPATRIIPPALLRSAVAGALAGAFLIALIGNRDYDRIRWLPTVAAVQFDIGEAGKSARARAAAERETVAELQRLVRETGYVVSSSDLRALWHFGHLDVVLLPTLLSEITPPAEFARDWRTGAVVIGQADSLARVMECQPRGVLIVWEYEQKWRQAHAVTDAVADLIERTMEPVALPAASDIRAFRWQSTTPRTAGCERVPSARSPTGLAGGKVH
ncbi:MAG: ArnT family glycosyltransferase [Burkholderiaceae bacterium]